jgi:acetolactate synthase-1/2/3 large subunit
MLESLTALLPLSKVKHMNLGTINSKNYEIELEAVINEELKPKKEGISMETIEMINKL